jgi:poly(hydroxyalkanoate) depolymerase family esterase
MLLLTAVACTTQGSSVGGRYVRGAVTAAGELYHYILYIPATRHPASGLPLVVVLHGCSETAAAVAAGANYRRVADRQRFTVLYLGVGTRDEAHYECWRGIWDPRAEGRGRGDAAAIAAMTRSVITRWRLDRSRVYAIGISAGAFETAILGATYPDLYAAIGIHSGAAYMAGVQGCPTSPRSITTLAQAARKAMGANAHVMPVIVFHGDRDDNVPYRCGRQALAQWLRTDNLILQHEGPIPLPALAHVVSRATVPGGYAYTLSSYADPAGCPVAQLWTIHGMGHFWSGGSTDPSSARYSDPRGPSAAAGSWAFFAHWRLSGRVDSCTPGAL